MSLKNDLISKNFVIEKSDTKYQNKIYYSGSDMIHICSQYQDYDYYQAIYVTRITIANILFPIRTSFIMESDNELFIFILFIYSIFIFTCSNSRITFTNFISSIFSAILIWIALFFILLNPIQHFLATESFDTAPP